MAAPPASPPPPPSPPPPAAVATFWPPAARALALAPPPPSRPPPLLPRCRGRLRCPFRHRRRHRHLHPRRRRRCLCHRRRRRHRRRFAHFRHHPQPRQPRRLDTPFSAAAVAPSLSSLTPPPSTVSPPLPPADAVRYQFPARAASSWGVHAPTPCQARWWRRLDRLQFMIIRVFRPILEFGNWFFAYF